MSGERPYPDEPASPFPEPPVSFSDREDRRIEVQGYDPGDAVPEPLVAMYDAYDPADRAQGIPPSGERRVRAWLAGLFEEGFNVVAWHDDEAVAHATLVAEGDPDDPGDGHYELAIFVFQPYQGAGVGQRLLRTLLGFGASRGVERVWLTVERWNRAAVGLYEDVGFEVVDAGTFEHEMALRL